MWFFTASSSSLSSGVISWSGLRFLPKRSQFLMISGPSSVLLDVAAAAAAGEGAADVASMGCIMSS